MTFDDKKITTFVDFSDDVTSEVVTISGNQVISGSKTFTDQINGTVTNATNATNAECDADGNKFSDTYVKITSVTNIINQSISEINLNVFSGANASSNGSSGIVPAPNSGDQNKFLMGNGSWTALSGYLPTTGGTITGALTVSSGITGNLTGLATSATKDAGGNDIRSTYVSSIGVSGKTVTYYNKSGTAIGSFTTQDTDTHYSATLKTGATATATANAASVNSATYLNLIENGTVRDSHQITGTGAVTVSTDSAGKIIISGTNTTYSTFTSATASANGTSGLVPAPTSGNQAKFLRADGTWQTPTDTNTDTKVTAVGNHYTPTSSTSKSATGGTDTNITNLASGSGVQVLTGLDMDAAGHITGVKSVALRSVDTNTDTHYTATLVTSATNSASTNAASVNSATYLNLIENGTVRNSHQIIGTGAVTVTTDSAGKITISGTNTTYSSLKNPYALTISGSSAVTYDGSSAVTASLTKSFVGLGNVDNVSVSSIIGSAMASGNTFSGTLASTATATTQSSTDSSTKVATTAFVKNSFLAVDAIVYKGTVDGSTSGTVSMLPSANKGDLYKVSTAGYVGTNKVEVGDMLICNTDSTASATVANWDIIQTNTDTFTGATASANGTTGLVPAPTSGNQAKFLRADGTWQTPTDTNTDTKVTAVGNHYTPTSSTSKSATGGADTNITNLASGSGVNVVTGLDMDAAGHITGVKSVALRSVDTNTNTDTKVTAVGNHYTPTSSTSKSATGGTDTNITNLASGSGVQVLTGLDMDAAGHITGVKSVALRSVDTNTDTHYTATLVTGATNSATANAASVNSATYLNLIENGTVRNSHQIIGAGVVTVSTDSTGKITISGSNTNTDTHYTTKVTVGTSGAASDTSAVNSNTYINVFDNTTLRKAVQITGASSATVSTAANGIITITATDTNTTYSTFTGATASANGTSGLVPLPSSGSQAKFLRADGTWQTPTDTNTHYSATLITGATNSASANAATANSATYLNLIENGTVRNSHQIIGAGVVTVSTDSAGKITISGSNTNTDTHYTATLKVGATATATANAATANSATYINLVENSTIRDSHQIIGAGTVTITADSAGKITISGSNTNTDTHYTASLITGATNSATANAATANSATYLNLIENSTVRNSHQIIGAGTVAVTTDSAGKITISGTAHNTYTNETLGQCYTTCTTSAATLAKTAAFTNYALIKGGIVSVKFSSAVPASATLNINSKGAKAIFAKGAVITAGIIAAGDIATFMYDGTQYQLISVDGAVSNASAWATSASTYATNASTYATSADTARGSAVTAQNNASKYATSASTANTSAQSANTSAQTAMTNASTYATSADTARGSAVTAQNNASKYATSASTANTSANTANTSAQAALTSAKALLSSYLPLSGGKMTGSIGIPALTTSYVGCLQGSCAISQNAGSAGSFLPILNYKTTNGVIGLGGYQGKLQLFYAASATVTSGTNTMAKSITLIDESGNGSWAGTITATGGFSGNLTGTAASATKDAGGNDIRATYVSSIGVSGKTVTYYNKSGTAIGSITTQDTNTTYSTFTGATASANGTSGLVPLPTSGNQAKFLRADGTWQTPTDTNTDTKVTNTLATTSKAYITGTTNSATNTGTQVFDTGVYLTTTAGNLYATTINTTSLTAEIASNTTAYGVLSVKSTNGANNIITVDEPNASSNYGKNVAFGGCGNTLIGGGESVLSALTDVLSSTSENLYLTADNAIIFYTSGNTWASKTTTTLGADGILSGTFKGNLTGLAASATGDAGGNDIRATYVSSIGVSGKTVTYYNKSGTAIGSFTTQDTDTDTHYTASLVTGATNSATANAATANSATYLNLIENSTVRNSHQIIGAGTVAVTTDSAGKITISGTAHNTYTNETLGQCYTTCTTSAATLAKTAAFTNYALIKGGIVSVKFSSAVPASATLNINSKGAKAIFAKGAVITAGIIAAGDIATFMYDGTQYQLISVDGAVSNASAWATSASTYATSANTARGSAVTAQNNASAYATSASTANTSAQSANTSAQSANTSAQTAMSNASTYATSANTARGSAVTAQNNASAYATSASTANTSANTANTSAQAALTSAKALLSSYLPLSGGTMTGTIITTATTTLKQSVNSSYVWMYGGNGNTGGASICLTGASQTNSGAFWVRANNGTSAYDLKGTTTGSLTWPGTFTNGSTLTVTTGGASITGNTTIAGTLGTTNTVTISTTAPALVLQDTNITRGTINTANQQQFVAFRDSAGNNLGYIDAYRTKNTMNQEARLIACSPASGTAAYLTVVYPSTSSTDSSGTVTYANGVPYATAPTYTTYTDSSTKIATTAWVRNMLASNSYCSKYLPLAGGTLTGALTGTTANFTGTSQCAAASINGALCVGNKTGNNMNISYNVIQAHSYDTTSSAVSTGALYLNWYGGNVSACTTGYTFGIKGSLSVAQSATVTGTVSASAVYNAVWNDYAEFYPRGEVTEVGDIIALDPEAEDEVYVKATKEKNEVVGIHSDSFGHLIGGEKAPEGEDFVEYNLPKFIPVGLKGRCKTKVIGKVKKGDRLVISDIAGVASAYNKETDDKYDIFGYACENNSQEEIKLVKVHIK